MGREPFRTSFATSCAASQPLSNPFGFHRCLVE